MPRADWSPPDDASRALRPDEEGLVRLSAAIGAGPPGDVTREARAAIAAGLAPDRLYEAALQSYLFVGFPRAIEALFAVRPVLEEQGVAPPESVPADPARFRERGEDLCRRVYGKNFDPLLRTIRGLSPDLAEWMIVEGYGKTLSRPALDPVDREYGVVAILTVTRMWRQLRSHAIGAVNVGATRAAVRASITLCAPWCGEPVVTEALAVTGLS